MQGRSLAISIDVAKDATPNGDESDEFLAALNEYFENIEIEMDDEGKLSFSGEAVTDDELMMVEALNDENVICNINTTSLPVTETKDLFCGGAAMGTELSEDKKSVVARQTVNPSVLNKVDNVKNTPGGSSVHEVTECYQAGLWSMKKERDLSVAKNGDRDYPKYHKRAGGSKHSVVGEIYNESGGLNDSRRVGAQYKVDGVVVQKTSWFTLEKLKR